VKVSFSEFCHISGDIAETSKKSETSGRVLWQLRLLKYKIYIISLMDIHLEMMICKNHIVNKLDLVVLSERCLFSKYVNYIYFICLFVYFRGGGGVWVIFLTVSQLRSYSSQLMCLIYSLFRYLYSKKETRLYFFCPCI